MLILTRNIIEIDPAIFLSLACLFNPVMALIVHKLAFWGTFR